MDLTPAQEATKLRAVRTYRTQTEVLGRFMDAFVRENELITLETAPSPR